LACFGYLKASKSEDRLISSLINKWLLFRTVAQDYLINVEIDYEHIRHLYENYLIDPRDGIMWSNVYSDISSSLEIGWEQHPGVRDLTTLMKFHNNPQDVDTKDLSPHLQNNLGIFMHGQKDQISLKVVDDMVDYCVIFGCSKAYIVDPEKRKLRDLLPVICAGCATLMVPKQIYDAFEDCKNGSNSK